MTFEGSPTTMQRLVAHLKAKGIITSPRVEDAMLKVDRAHYCPSQYPYMDSPYSIDYGATISAPHMHAYALEVMKDRLKEGAKVLDVGSGSGYLTACLAHMLGPMGVVFGVEHIKELVKQSEENIKKDCSELLTSGRVKLMVADGRVGLPEQGPFDAIHVGATAKDLPSQLTNQLKEGGIMVLPVQNGQSQMFERVEKLLDGQIMRKQLFGVRYVPLTDVESQLMGRQ